MRSILLVTWLASAAGPPSPRLAESDALYLSRDQPGRLEQAIETLRLRLKEGEEPAASWRLGRCLIRKGQGTRDKASKLELYKEAERFLRRSAALDASEPEARYWLGLALGLRGQLQGMMRSLFLVKPIRREMEAALALDPSHGPAHMLLGEMLGRLPSVAGGSQVAALDHFQKAVAGDPGYTPPYLALARLHAAAGRSDQARAALERLLAIREPKDPVEAAGDQAEARSLLQGLGDSAEGRAIAEGKR